MGENVYGENLKENMGFVVSTLWYGKIVGACYHIFFRYLIFFKKSLMIGDMHPGSNETLKLVQT